jgi:hypothetical protein
VTSKRCGNNGSARVKVKVFKSEDDNPLSSLVSLFFNWEIASIISDLVRGLLEKLKEHSKLGEGRESKFKSEG